MRGMIGLAALFILNSAATAGDWPQWLGPKRDGSSDEKVSPWKQPLKILWKQPVGEGHSSPIVAQDRVFLHTRVKDTSEEQLAAYDASTGKPLWTAKYERAAFKSLFGNGPRATPSAVAGKVYTYGITGLLTCFDAETGKQLWQVDALKEFKAPNLFFGASCSPLVAGERILMNVGAKAASIVAFDKETGKTLWQQLDDKASYSSGNLIGQQAVFLTAKGLVGLAPDTGKVYWQHPLVDALSESSTTPVAAGDVLFGSSVTFGGLGLRLEKTDDGPKAKELWKKPELNCYFATPVAVGKEHLYVVTATKPPAILISSTLRCIEAETGKELWNRPNVGKYHASLLRTGDDKLLLLEESGQLVLLEPNTQAYKELARSKVCGNTWAHPALVGGKLYIRDDKELVCVELTQ